MKKILAAMAFSLVIPFSSVVKANDFPNWPVSATCKSGDSSCARFETLVRGEVSGVWNTLPPKARAACVSETESVERSYRLLQSCLANAMQEILKDQQRSPEGGEVVQLTPMAKRPEPEPAPEPAEPAAPAATDSSAPAATPDAVKPQ